MASTLVVKINGDASGLRAETDQAEGVLSGFGSKLGALGVAGGNLLAGGIQAGATAAVGFLGDSIGAASDLGETLSKVGVIFGDSRGEVEAFASTASGSIGQSRQQALDAAATFATFGKSAGLAGKDLVGFSTDFTVLASDLASFNNTTPEDAIEALGSALRGEAEPMRKYGVLLDDNTLRQAALKLGLIKTTSEALTPQNKVLAAQAEIMRQTTAAQGDFARTSDGLANSQRTLSAKVEDAKAKIGEALLPAMQAVTRWAVDSLVPAFENRVIPAMQTMAKWVNEHVVPAITTMVKWVRDELAPRVSAFAETVAEKMIPVLDKFGNWLNMHVVPALKDLWVVIRDQLIPMWIKFADYFADRVIPVLKEVGDWLNRHVLPRLGDLVTIIVDHAVPALSAYYRIIAEDVIPVIRRVAEWIADQIGWWVRLEVKIVENVASIVRRVYEFASAVVDAFGRARDWVNDFPGRVVDAVASIANVLVQAGRDTVTGFLRGIQERWHAVTDWIGDRFDALPDIVKKALGISSPSRVMAELGRWTMAGFAAGLSANEVDIADHISLSALPGGAMSQRFVAAAGSATPAIRTAGGSAGPSGPIVVQLVLDRRVLADTIVDLTRSQR